MGVVFAHTVFQKTCKCVSACVRVSQFCYTDVSQSAPLRAEACPSLGSLPTQEVSVLTHCIPEALRGEIHPITVQRGRVTRIIHPVGMRRVNFTVTTAADVSLLSAAGGKNMHRLQHSQGQ